MRTEPKFRGLLKSLVAAGASGMLFAGTCSSGEFQAVVAGFNAAAQELEDQNEPVTFEDFILGQLDRF